MYMRLSREKGQRLDKGGQDYIWVLTAARLVQERKCEHAALPGLAPCQPPPRLHAQRCQGQGVRTGGKLYRLESRKGACWQDGQEGNVCLLQGDTAAQAGRRV